MELKHKLEKIFNDDYPGTERFIADVIEPIFGNEIENINDDLAERDEYAEKAKKAGIKHIKYIGNLTEKNYNADNIALLDVTLDDSKNIERSRVNIQQLIRSIMDYRQHLMIVFHYEDVADRQWRFSYAYKGDSLKDSTSAKRYTYVFGKGYRGRTAAERFEILAKSPRNNEDFEDAFSVQALSDEFFDLYRAYYAAFVEFITGVKYTVEKKLNTIISRWDWLQTDNSGQYTSTFEDNAKDVRDYIKKMFGRIVFLYFLQRKGWLYDAEGNSDARYMRHLFDGAGGLKNTFLDDVLELLFFYVLNTKPEQRVQEASLEHKDITILPGWEKIPFLNGGLFCQDEYDPKRCVFPAIYFDKLFEFLDSYNFTIDENDQEDAEVGIDPEMLGRIFENLLEDNRDKGAFYTPKEIVDYMCRESIISYLQNEPKNYTPAKAREFIEALNIDILNEDERAEIERRLIKVKICDPAIGSGAFPMGLVNLLSKVFIVLRTYSNIDQARMKRYIMEQSIYGVDIEQGAVDIARLRFWLAMVVDEQNARPLPNLNFKIMQGNSLLESYNGHDLSHICMGVDSSGQYAMDFNGWQQILRNDINTFYSTDNHDKRAKILTDIKNNVIRQIFETTGNEHFLNHVKDVSANQNFFLWHTWFADVFEQGGFDIIIGNPPYKIIRSEEKKIYNFPIMEGHVDLYELFIQLSYVLAKEKGCVMMIHPNTLLTNLYSEKLRKFLTSRFGISEITNFSMDVFLTPIVHTCITKCKKNSESEFISIRKSVRNFNELRLSYDFKLAVSEITNSANYTFDISLNEFERSLFRKISVYPKLGDICYLRQCIKTGNDKEYVRISDEPLPPPWKKSLRGKGISKYHIKERNLYIKYGDWLARNWNNTSFYERKKIAIREAGKVITACIDEDNSYFLSSIYAVYPKKEYDEDMLLFLLGILNSKFATFYVTKIAFDLTEGAFTKMRTNQLARLPINNANSKLYKMISLNTKEIVNSKKLSSERDTACIEIEIDHIVYHLYDLTYDEVLIVDPETPITREQYENFNHQ